ncbi:hypothetical protein [Brachyspira pilosicoli]
MIIAIIIPPLIPVAIEIIDNVNDFTNFLEIKAAEEDKVKAASGAKKLFISKTSNTSGDSLYKNNDEIHLEKLCDSFYIFFDVTEAELDKFKIKVEMENEPKGYELINIYYKIIYYGETKKVNDQHILFDEQKFNNNQDFFLKIEKNHNDGGNNNIYIDIEVGANTMINNEALSSFRLILKP